MNFDFILLWYRIYEGITSCKQEMEVLLVLIMLVVLYCGHYLKQETSKNMQKASPGSNKLLPSQSPLSKSVSSRKGSFKFEYDVFLSFRGADTRKGFAGNLYQLLSERGVRVFMDDEGLNKGEHIENIFRAIEMSEIFIPIFSSNYANSKWCLMELTKMVNSGRMIVPVFIDVDPSDVRNQTGPYEAAFIAYEKNQKVDQNQVNHWREALRKAGGICGYELSEADGNEYKRIQIIIKRILCEVIQTPFDVAKYPVGLESRIDDIMELLDMETYDVRIIGIYGIGGIGKTTLAKAIYNKISSSFEATCYLLNVREEAESNGIVSLQKKLICDILKDTHTVIKDVSQGISLIKRRLQFKRVLLVLDDVNDESQLDAIAGSRDWFCERSRFIITTRCRNILEASRLEEGDIYQVEELNPTHSLQLFSHHAFGREKPAIEYEDLSKKVVRMAGGLPLALEVYGSLFFYKRNLNAWETVLKKLEITQHEKIYNRLRVSYDELDENEKQIFLDITCFFVGKGKENAIHMWKDSDLFPVIAIDVLLHRSLIKINTEKNEFEMHDQIQCMGRQIVLQEGISEPGKRSRLWDAGQIQEMLQYLEGTRNVEGIVSVDMGKQKILTTEAFAAMGKLRLLHVNYTDIQGEFHHFPKKLKWLKWKGCPLKALPYDFNPEKLVVLELSLSKITEVWTQSGNCKNKIFPRMKVLNLFGCQNLKRTPDFATVPHLEKLVLDRCVHLTEVHESIGQPKNLIFLSLRGCEALQKLPNEICKLNSLEMLILQGCYKFSNLPEGIGDMKSLKELDLSMTATTQIPCSMGYLSNLQTLDCRFCKSLIVLPSSLGNASSLKRLYLPACVQLPESIGSLSNLEELEVSQCKKVKALPSSLGKLQKLLHLVISSTSISELPENLADLHMLQHLDLSGNIDLTALPYCFSLPSESHISPRRLSSLKILNLSGSSINVLPSTISDCLIGLEELYLESSIKLQALPQLPSSLIILDASFCYALEKITDLSNLTRLKKLHLEGCMNLVNVIGLEALESLESLRMNGCFSLSDDLWNISLKESTFQHLEKYSIEGRPSYGNFGRPMLSFVIPKGARNKYNLHGCLVFPYWISSSVHLSVEIPSGAQIVYETTKPVYKLAKGYIVRFEVDDVICSYLKARHRMIRVSMYDSLPRKASMIFHFCNKEHFPRIVDDIFLAEMRFGRVRCNKGTNGAQIGYPKIPNTEEKSDSLPDLQKTIAPPMSIPDSAPAAADRTKRPSTKGFGAQIPKLVSLRTRENVILPILQMYLPSIKNMSFRRSKEVQSKRITSNQASPMKQAFSFKNMITVHMRRQISSPSDLPSSQTDQCFGSPSTLITLLNCSIEKVNRGITHAGGQHGETLHPLHKRKQGKDMVNDPGLKSWLPNHPFDDNLSDNSELDDLLIFEIEI